MTTPAPIAFFAVKLYAKPDRSGFNADVEVEVKGSLNKLILATLVSEELGRMLRHELNKHCTSEGVEQLN